MFLISSEHIFKVNPFKFELLIQCIQCHALLPSASTSSEEKVRELNKETHSSGKKSEENKAPLSRDTQDFCQC